MSSLVLEGLDFWRIFCDFSYALIHRVVRSSRPNQAWTRSVRLLDMSGMVVEVVEDSQGFAELEVVLAVASIPVVVAVMALLVWAGPLARGRPLVA